MWKLVITLLLTTSRPAASAQYLVDGGLSPDGRYELRIQGNEPDGIDYEYCIYDCETDTPVYTSTISSGYGTFVMARRTSKALWNDGSSVVALTERVSKSSNALHIFARRWSEFAELPLPDYCANMLGRLDAVEFSYSQHAYLHQWISFNFKNEWWIDDLLIKQIGSLDRRESGRSFYSCNVVLTVTGGRHMEPYVKLTWMSDPFPDHF